MVGSPEYMAIEILEEQGYTHLVDFWSLGVILFELLYGIVGSLSSSLPFFSLPTQPPWLILLPGITPFTAESVDEVFEKLAFALPHFLSLNISLSLSHTHSYSVPPSLPHSLALSLSLAFIDHLVAPGVITSSPRRLWRGRRSAAWRACVDPYSSPH